MSPREISTSLVSLIVTDIGPKASVMGPSYESIEATVDVKLAKEVLLNVWKEVDRRGSVPVVRLPPCRVDLPAARSSDA